VAYDVLQAPLSPLVPAKTSAEMSHVRVLGKLFRRKEPTYIALGTLRHSSVSILQFQHYQVISIGYATVHPPTCTVAIALATPSDLPAGHRALHPAIAHSASILSYNTGYLSLVTTTFTISHPNLRPSLFAWLYHGFWSFKVSPTFSGFLSLFYVMDWWRSRGICPRDGS
jgi:hypothetical protein